MKALGSMRARLAIIGFVGLLAVLSVLLTVTFATEETVETDEVEPGVENIESTVTAGGVSPWVPITALLLAIPGGLAVWWWAGRAVGPIARITDVADEIQEGSLDHRIALTGAPDEVQSLADSFDRMLDRLQASSDQQQHLLEEVAHELRTPLAALAAHLENLTAAVETDHADRPTITRAVTDLDRQVERLQTTLDAVLRDARADERRLAQVDNDLVAIVAGVADQQRAASPGLRIVTTGPDRCPAAVDGAAVTRALTNLVENAARFTPPDGEIHIDITTDDTTATVSVTDEGPGLDLAEQKRLFTRHARGDDTHNGNGIGLAIVAQVADAYEGLEVESPLTDDGGTRITLRLPV